MPPDLLLGEWACLGVLGEGPAHGYAVARRLKADGDLGRVWTMSRPMVYRCLADLEAKGLVAAGPVTSAGGRERTELRLTRSGTTALDRWLDAPAAHLRDVRTELLIKLIVGGNLDHDPSRLLSAQREMADRTEAKLLAMMTEGAPVDPVILWRLESVGALRRMIDRLQP